MSCKTINVELKPITHHEVEEIEWLSYKVENNVEPTYEYKILQDNYSFMYCVSYLDPDTLEWILARWWWNDAGVWTADWIFPM